MNRTRLAIVAEDLEAIARIPLHMEAPMFNLNTWIGGNLLASDREGIVADAPMGLSCGTAACAVGMACFNPKLRKMGLDMELASYGRNIQPTYNGYTQWAAVEKFFGLTENQVLSLFGGRYYEDMDLPTEGREGAAAVAKHIRTFIRKGKKKPAKKARY